MDDGLTLSQVCATLRVSETTAREWLAEVKPVASLRNRRGKPTPIYSVDDVERVRRAKIAEHEADIARLGGLMFRFDSNQWFGVVASREDFWRAVDDLIHNGYREPDALAYLLGQPERAAGVFSYFNMNLKARPFREVCPPEWLVRPTSGADT